MDDLLVELRRLTADCAERDDRNGYFAALYTLMTERVRDDITAGRFRDGERLERLACHFAMRYFDAWGSYRSGSRAPESWTVAFETAPRWRPLILQHLLLGMNAHINFDLGIAAAEVADGDDLERVRDDFMEINGVLADLVGEVQLRLASASPWMSVLDRVGARTDQAIFNFSMRHARDAAWRVAEQHAVLDEPGRAAATHALDERIASFASVVAHPGRLISAGALIVRLRERAPVGDVIAALHAR